jgi:hypothetical protein
LSTPSATWCVPQRAFRPTQTKHMPLQEIAQKLIQSSVMKDESGNPVNPLDAHFRSLDLTSMDPIAPSAKEFKTLDKYVQDTHGMTHRHFKVRFPGCPQSSVD